MMRETARSDLTVPNGSAAGHRCVRDGNRRCLEHHKQKHSFGNAGRKTKRAKPTSAGQALEEEDVMQSTDGSRPKGLLT
jgi:hypothetical protein